MIAHEIAMTLLQLGAYAILLGVLFSAIYKTLGERMMTGTVFFLGGLGYVTVVEMFLDKPLGIPDVILVLAFVEVFGAILIFGGLGMLITSANDAYFLEKEMRPANS